MKQVRKGDLRIEEVKARLKRVEEVPSETKKDRHGRNIQLYEHGICVSGNKLVNNILDQVYAKRNDCGNNDDQCSECSLSAVQGTMEPSLGNV